MDVGQFHRTGSVETGVRVMCPWSRPQKVELASHCSPAPARNRREVVALVGGAVMGGPFVARAQQRSIFDGGISPHGARITVQPSYPALFNPLQM
jgi:hypothetical protein